MFLLSNLYLFFIVIVWIQHVLLPYRINDFDFWSTILQKFFTAFTAHLWLLQRKLNWGSFWRRSSQPISWLGTEKTRPKKTKLENTKPNDLSWYKNTKIQTKSLQHYKYNQIKHACITKHTHTRLTAPFRDYLNKPIPERQKPFWILLKQEPVSGSGISWAVCKSSPRSRHITTPAPHHSFFTGRMPLLPPNQQGQSTEGITKHRTT